MVREIKSVDEFNSVLASADGALVVVDFFATWCGPCKMIAPMIEKFSQEYTEVIFLKVDVDELSDLAQTYEITAMPTIVLIQNNEQITKVVGANVAAIKEAIHTHRARVPPPAPEAEA